MLDRDKLIAEVYGLAALLETWTPEDQADTLKSFGLMLADPKHYRNMVRRLNRERKEYGEEIDKIRREELGGKGDGPIIQLLMPLTDSKKTLGKLDNIIAIECQRIMNERRSEEAERRIVWAGMDYAYLERSAKGGETWTAITGATLQCIREIWKAPDATVDIWPLSFYERGCLVRGRNKAKPEYYIAARHDFEKAEWWWLNGTSEPIYGANTEAVLKLDAGNILDYLRFFCNSLVYGAVMMEICDEGVRERWEPWGGHVRTAAPVFTGMAGDRFLCRAHVFYAGNVFESEFSISPDNGEVKMLGDKPVSPE